MGELRDDARTQVQQGLCFEQKIITWRKKKGGRGEEKSFIACIPNDLFSYKK